MSKAYKVFKKLKNGSLVSAGDIPRRMRFTFSRTEVNIPKIKGSEFFVFKTKNDVNEFIESVDSNKDYEIWQVKTGRMTRRKRLPPAWLDYQINTYEGEFFSFVKNFWLAKVEESNIFRLQNCSDGAYSTPTIQLIKKVN